MKKIKFDMYLDVHQKDLLIEAGKTLGKTLSEVLRDLIEDYTIEYVQESLRTYKQREDTFASLQQNTSNYSA